jgi:hypothetical protein
VQRGTENSERHQQGLLAARGSQRIPNCNACASGRARAGGTRSPAPACWCGRPPAAARPCPPSPASPGLSGLQAPPRRSPLLGPAPAARRGTGTPAARPRPRAPPAGCACPSAHAPRTHHAIGAAAQQRACRPPDRACARMHGPTRALARERMQPGASQERRAQLDVRVLQPQPQTKTHRRAEMRLAVLSRSMPHWKAAGSSSHIHRWPRKGSTSGHRLASSMTPAPLASAGRAAGADAGRPGGPRVHAAAASWSCCRPACARMQPAYAHSMRLASSPNEPSGVRHMWDVQHARSHANFLTEQGQEVTIGQLVRGTAHASHCACQCCCSPHPASQHPFPCRCTAISILQRCSVNTKQAESFVSWRQSRRERAHHQPGTHREGPQRRPQRRGSDETVAADGQLQARARRTGAAGRRQARAYRAPWRAV